MNGSEIVLGSGEYLKFVTAINGGGGSVRADGSSAGSSERFQIVKITSGDNYIYSGNQVAFKTSGNQYWRAVDGGGGDLVADRTSVGPDETFTISFIDPQGR